MGFFSDIMKNPLVQMALPMALSYFMPGIGSLVGTSAISNPMMRSAAEQALLGYGTAKLTGSKHPEKAAMYAGLGSMPFSFMKAQGAANMYNKDMKALGNLDKDIFKTERFMSDPGRKFQKSYLETFGEGPGGLEQSLGIGSPDASAIYHPELSAIDPTYDYRIPSHLADKNYFSLGQGYSEPGDVTKFLEAQQKLKDKPLTAWDVLKGKDDRMIDIPERRYANVMKDVERLTTDPNTMKQEMKVHSRSPWREGDPILPTTEMGIPEVDFYSKIGKGQKNLLGQELTKGDTFTAWTPTIASQTAGWYGGRPTSEEEWEDAKKRRRKELAFMYGIDESLMGGEMENPYYGGGGFWKDGGIAALNMDTGGAVNGPGGPKDDVIDAKLSDGEFVMTAKAVENLGGGDRLAGAKQMYNMMNQLDPQSETVQESVIGV